MKKLSLLTIVFIISVPILFAADEDGSALGFARTITAPDQGGKGSGSITTMFAMNGGYAGNTFDIIPFSNLNEITAMDINWTSAGEIVEVDTYFKLGTAYGYETSPGDWTSLASGTGVGAGIDLPTFIDLSGNGIPFPATGERYGIAMGVTNYSSLKGYLGYTNGQYMFSNADVELQTQHGLGDPIFSSAFYPRCWNGTLYYNTGLPPALNVYPKSVSTYYGGTFTFYLYGEGLEYRVYVILGSASGTTPPMTLPGGATLDLAKDWFTSLVMQAALAGGYGIMVDFIGFFDGNGYAKATLTLPAHCQIYEDLYLWFAWTTIYPFDYQSNTVKVLLDYLEPPGENYEWDDGN